MCRCWTWTFQVGKLDLHSENRRRVREIGWRYLSNLKVYTSLICPNIQTCTLHMYDRARSISFFVCKCSTSTFMHSGGDLNLRVAWRFDSATQFVKSKFLGRQLMMVTMLQLNSGQRCLDQMLPNSSPKEFGISFGHFRSSTSSKTHARWGH